MESEATFARLRELKATEALPAPAPLTVPPAPTAPPDAARTHLHELITSKTRRLHHLEQQQAFKGASTPPEILMDLEDLRRELADLEKQLAEIDGWKTEPSDQ